MKHISSLIPAYVPLNTDMSVSMVSMVSIHGSHVSVHDQCLFFPMNTGMSVYMGPCTHITDTFLL